MTVSADGKPRMDRDLLHKLLHPAEHAAEEDVDGTDKLLFFNLPLGKPVTEVKQQVERAVKKVSVLRNLPSLVTDGTIDGPILTDCL